MKRVAYTNGFIFAISVLLAMGGIAYGHVQMLTLAWDFSETYEDGTGVDPSVAVFSRVYYSDSPINDDRSSDTFVTILDTADRVFQVQIPAQAAGIVRHFRVALYHISADFGEVESDLSEQLEHTGVGHTHKLSPPSNLTVTVN